MTQSEFIHQELEDDLSQMVQSLREFDILFETYATDTYDAVRMKDYKRAERHLNSLYIHNAPYIEALLRCYHRVKLLTNEWI